MTIEERNKSEKSEVPGHIVTDYPSGETPVWIPVVAFVYFIVGLYITISL